MKALRKLIFGFKYAFTGIWYCIKSCRNFRIHTVAVAVVLYFSSFYDFDKTTYAVIFTIIALVLSLEAMNTSIEQACDTEYSDRIKHAKDSAAASVLCACIFAVVISILLFWDTFVFLRIYTYFSKSVIRLLFLILSIIVAIIYIFYEDIFKNGKQ